MARKIAVFKKPKILIPLILVVLISAATISAVRNLNSPAQGTIVQNNESGGSSKSTPGLQDYADSVISFSYPGKFQTVPAQKSPGYLDAVNLIKTDKRDEYVSISVIKESLDMDPGVAYRRQHPDLYKANIEGSSSYVFTKLDSTELTGFIQRGDKVASISFTSVSPHDMAPDYVTIANSLGLK